MVNLGFMRLSLKTLMYHQETHSLLLEVLKKTKQKQNKKNPWQVNRNLLFVSAFSDAGVQKTVC